MSLSFIAPSSLSRVVVNDAHEVRDLGDHAANSRRVLKRGTAADLVQTQTLEGLALLVGTADVRSKSARA
jgi:hypothetical protein